MALFKITDPKTELENRLFEIQRQGRRITLHDHNALMDEQIPQVTNIHNAQLYFDWAWKYCGFGQLSVSHSHESGELTCMNETMGQESVRKLLHAFADYVADNVELIEVSNHGDETKPKSGNDSDTNPG